MVDLGHGFGMQGVPYSRGMVQLLGLMKTATATPILTEEAVKKLTEEILEPEEDREKRLAYLLLAMSRFGCLSAAGIASVDEPDTELLASRRELIRGLRALAVPLLDEAEANAGPNGGS